MLTAQKTESTRNTVAREAYEYVGSYPKIIFDRLAPRSRSEHVVRVGSTPVYIEAGGDIWVDIKPLYGRTYATHCVRDEVPGMWTIPSLAPGNYRIAIANLHEEEHIDCVVCAA